MRLVGISVGAMSHGGFVAAMWQSVNLHMSMDLEPHDVVSLPAGLPEHDVPAGARATILLAYDHPRLAYEIEVSDDSGQPLFIGTVDPTQVQLVWRDPGNRIDR